MRSLSLKAYEALARSASDPAPTHRPARPQGTVIWAVVHSSAEARAMIYLHDRLVHLRGPSHLLLTSPGDSQFGGADGAVFEHLPPDQPAATKAFLTHWQPDICIWMSGDLSPTLIAETKAAGIALFLLGAKSEDLDKRNWRWMPGLLRDTLAAFDVITAETAEAAKNLRKALPKSREIGMSAPLQIATPVPTVSDEHLQELTEMIDGRSVWLAARVQEDELGAVLEAHRTTIQMAHRLLLVLVCANFSVAMTARKKLTREKWRCCYWDDGDLIDEATQIVVVEDPDDMGLWLRAAPVSFLGSSLRAGYGGSDPYEAAALGSAVIYGPHVREHLPGYSRLAAVGAARIVADAPSLSRALWHLLSVDQAASMAHAAWQVISSGAQATDAVAQQIHELMDQSEGVSAQ